MRERELDEFQSVFQRSIIPTIEVSKIELRKILVLSAEDARGAECAKAVEVLGASEIVRRAVGDAAELDALIAEERPSMIVAHGLGGFADALLVATPLPTLIVRGACRLDMFDRILAKIPEGRHDLIEQFSFAFRLCRPGGTIRLLHVVDKQRLRRLAEALEVTPEVDSAAEADVLAAVKTRMDHLLRGAIRVGEGAGFHVESAIEVGDPFEIVPRHATDFSLLIVGSQSAHAQFLESRAYALMRHVPDLPVLAL